MSPLNNAPMNPLDNPIWEALRTSLERFAEVNGTARRFPPEVTLLAGFAEPTREAFESLGRLQADGRPSVLFLHRAIDPPASWKVIETDTLAQMVAERETQMPAAPDDVIELGDSDTADMMALAKLTKPGPFGLRTRELGTFLGVRREGRLAAMAGERLRLAGYAEISAVCTHPDFLGRGFAGALMAAVMTRMRKKGETPILHVRADNLRAIELYTRLGFVERRRFEFLVSVPLAK
jgi:ribosomal protein S18 acetylase RimI-like enzyme